LANKEKDKPVKAVPQSLPRAEPLDLPGLDWSSIHEEFSAPFPDDEVHKKKQATSGSGSELFVSYIESRSVMNRLDEVVGPENWEFDVEYLTSGVIKGILTVCGVTKSDIGSIESPDHTTAVKGCASDALKRAAVHFGIGRYLYDQERQWTQPGQALDRRQAPAPRRDYEPPESIRPTENTFIVHCQQLGLKTQKEICSALGVPLSKGESMSVVLQKQWIGAKKSWEDAIDHVDAITDIIKKEECTLTEANVQLAMGTV